MLENDDVAVDAVFNLNKRFIEFVSNPAGVIALFFGGTDSGCTDNADFCLPGLQEENS